MNKEVSLNTNVQEEKQEVFFPLTNQKLFETTLISEEKFLAQNSNQETLKIFQEFPSFLKTENKFWILRILFSFLFLIGSIILIILISVGISKNKAYVNDYIWAGILGSITLIYFIVILCAFWRFRVKYNHAKHFEDEKRKQKFLIYTRDLYAKIYSSFSNINFLSFIIYFIAAINVLISFIAAYFLAKEVPYNQFQYSFGQLYLNPKDNNPFYLFPIISVIISASISAITLMYQIIAQIVNARRLYKISNFSPNVLLSHKEKRRLIKSVNRRNLILFCIITLVLSFVVLFIWLMFKFAIKRIVRR